jgi:filamentous hemagglutinin
MSLRAARAPFAPSFRPMIPSIKPSLFQAAAILGLCVTSAFAPMAQARDILRPGSGGGAAPQGKGAAGGANTAGSAAAALAGKNARDVLARTSKVVQSMEQMQSAARKLRARNANTGLLPGLPAVPNGLATGGLQVAPGVPKILTQPAAGENAALWQGAKLPTQAQVKGRTVVNIEQTKAQAVLNWQTFNVGSQTTVNFDQRAGDKKKGGSNSWIAFNKIADPTGVPSQIMGAIKAQGSVYLINQNGIIFGGTSQVNVRSFVASSLPINDNLIGRGLLNNPDSQFLFSALAMPAGANGTSAFTPPPSQTASGQVGDVIVQPGARLISPSSSDKVGGRVALIGADVHNGGSISTPDGQTILAAGLQVGLAAHPSGDASLRGLDVYVGAVSAPNGPVYAGTATNAGLIKVDRANATIAGRSVNQNGVISGTTSVSLNGRIDLLANYDPAPFPQTNAATSQDKPPFLFRQTGAVTLSRGSVTQILPELGSSETVVGTELALVSRVKIQGRTAHAASGSTLLAPNANVTVDAGIWKYTGGNLPQSTFVYSGGQIYLDSNSVINVAGTAGVQAPVTQNIISAELRGSELADAPLQRTGLLRGTSVSVDVRQAGFYNGFQWVGSPLFNASGYVGLIQRDVGQLTIAGGTVKLSAGGSVVLQQGSKIDVSGGYIDYQGAMVQTTRVLSGGVLMDISQATPDVVYEGFYTGKFVRVAPKYGVAETFTNPILLDGRHFEAGYVYGANGGTITITAPAMALDGTLRGATVEGLRQRAVAPALSTLALNFQAQDASNVLFPNISPTPPNITFQPEIAQAPVGAFTVGEVALPASRLAQVFLSPALFEEGGFGHLQITDTDGDITVPAEVEVNAPARGSITLAAANINVQGKISAPGGSLLFSVYNLSPVKVAELRASANGAETPPADLARGLFTLGTGARLSTAGLLVDDRLDAPAPETLPLAINGGTISIRAYSADLQTGSTIDVSGGVQIAARGRQTFGDGGSIVIAAGQDLSLASVLGGKLTLGSELKGYSGRRAGALTIQAPLIQVGGSTANPSSLLLAPEFFNQGGFGSFTLNGLGAATAREDQFIPAVFIAPGTQITPVAQSLIALPKEIAGEGMRLVPIVKPEGTRTPVSLSFGASGVSDEFTKLLIVRGDIVVGAGAQIATDALGSVTVKGQTVLVLGSILAPGGFISISGGKDSSSLFLANRTVALPTVDIGSDAVLSTAGRTLLTFDPRGYRTGRVLPGGSIAISGNLVLEKGARLDVSGASDVLFFPPSYATLEQAQLGSLHGARMVPIPVESSAGAITLQGAQALYTEATLVGQAGGPTAQGGSLSVSSGRFYQPGVIPTPLDVTLQVTQASQIALARPATGSFIGAPVRRANGAALESGGYFGVDNFTAGGFDALTLGGTVRFAGPVSITARRSLSVADSGVLFADSAVRLTAPYVALGQTFIAPRPPESQDSPFVKPDGSPFPLFAAYGAGSLTVKASLIDLGNLSLQGIGRANFLARGGDIRGNGTLNVAGAIVMEAGQVYAPTASSFVIAASDYTVGDATRPGSVTFRSSGARQLPLSAGGSLSVYGSIIDQGGVLRAPLGSITLGWDGTGTAPVNGLSGASQTISQQITLRAGSITSVSAVDPATGEPLVIPYGLNLNDVSWIDPRGTDITVDGPPQKAITIAGVKVFSQAGSTIDLQGGGDLYAYRWVSGIGGSKDILLSATSFAILPGSDAASAPYAPYSDRPITTNLGTDPGYVNGSLYAGDQVYLGASANLPAGFYTLLPARYALLPGAQLVTPRSGTPIGTFAFPDDSHVVSGYRTNSFANPAAPARYGSFEIASGDVVRARAEYRDYSANQFFTAAAASRDLATPRLPNDAGHLIFSAKEAMQLKGSVLAQAPSGARGGLVDISSPVDIVIGGSGTIAAPGTLVLNAADLSNFGAESLLIGGIRQLGAGSATVTVNTGNLTVDNAGTPLRAPDLILVAKKSLTVAEGARIEQTGDLGGPADTLFVGDHAVPGSGDGLLIRASGDANARVVRAGVTTSEVPAMTIGAGALISGAGLILDSTYATALDPAARLVGTQVALNSGQVSIQLDNPGSLFPDPLTHHTTAGLVLSGAALDTLLATARGLSLLSYSTLDLYGTGRVGGASLSTLAVHAAEIRGFNTGGGEVTLAARQISLDRPANARVLSAVFGAAGGQLTLNGGSIRIGAGVLGITHFSQVVLTGSGGIIGAGTGGLNVAGALTLRAPIITGARVASQTISASGALVIESTAGQSSVSPGLGASLNFEGASVTHGGRIVLPSGLLKVRATNGDLVVTGQADARGTAQSFFERVKYTDAGAITLVSETGNVTLGAESVVDVSAAAGGGDAGTLSVSAPAGLFSIEGTVRGQAGVAAAGGSFLLDTSRIEGNSLATLNQTLNDGGFDTLRSVRVRKGDVLVDGTATTHRFDLSTDAGAIRVTGTIDASGAHGGVINLAAFSTLTLENGAGLLAQGVALNTAGKGGAVTLETRTGLLTLGAGSTVDLSIGTAVGGTLHLRAPQQGGPNFVAVNPLDGSVLNASSIVVEGFAVLDANTTGAGSIDSFQTAAFNTATLFMTRAPAIQARLLAVQPGLASVFHVRPGTEIINSRGDLILNNDWDLSTWRFSTPKAVVGANGQPLVSSEGTPIVTGVEPGILTLRARGSITFNGSLTDGFGTGAGLVDVPLDANGRVARWKDTLLPLFADGTAQQSYAYRITAGADLTAVDFRRVLTLPVGGTATSGSILIGVDGGTNIANPFGANGVIDTAINPPNRPGRFQVIRTGTGDIEINAQRDVKLLNHFASIYTAGARVTGPTLGGTFDVPRLFVDADGSVALYPAQYSEHGGNVSITAQGDIAHQTRVNGVLMADSQRELPMNWLYRRGYVDQGTGAFGTALFGDVASTSWWIDFSNFFQGAGALGGGNVTMISGHDISNVDAVIPTNARMAKGVPGGLIELGGGDLVVRAGHDIDAGVYYVERGAGKLEAGNSIHTNNTRSPSLTRIDNSAAYVAETWLPTTLFLGKSTFDVSARGDLLLGPMANPFLLPQGLSNSFWYKSYFSTLSPESAVNVSSLAGSVTLRTGTTLPNAGVGSTVPILQAWLQKELLYSRNADSASYYQPWLRLAETSVAPFATASTLAPATLRATAFTGDINLVGALNLSPAPRGTLDFAAAGSFRALQVSGVTTINNVVTKAWTAGTINLSDATPASIPGVGAPIAYQSAVGLDTLAATVTGSTILLNFDALFRESGSSTGLQGVLQTKQALHAPGLLHAGDPAPVYLFARSGDITGVTLFSSKEAQIVAGHDIRDIALYLQNVDAENTSVVSAGRDIVAYDANSPLRVAARSLGNSLNIGSGTLAGDIQISGPGALQVLAGRNLDLGVGPNNADGTGLGIVSIGNARNPFLPQEGGAIFAGAGLGEAVRSLEKSDVDVDALLTQISALPTFAGYLTEVSPDEPLTLKDLDALTGERRANLAVKLLYLVLRDAGRSQTTARADLTAGGYADGFAAIAALFPEAGKEGNISLTSREIKTRAGGDVSIFAPAGMLTVGLDVGTNQPLEQGILTESGGNISIFTQGDVNVGTSRIFTLRGGNEVIWSSTGNIAAGASSKTVQSAPPTRVIVDPQTADVQTDLAGLATGGGIGVLATVTGVAPGNVDLIAPAGIIDAGDAGIRVSGNLNLSATAVVNAGNIQAGGSTAGAPAAPSVAAPNLGSLSAAASSAGATASAATDLAERDRERAESEEAPSVITIEVVSYTTEAE